MNKNIIIWMFAVFLLVGTVSAADVILAQNLVNPTSIRYEWGMATQLKQIRDCKDVCSKGKCRTTCTTRTEMETKIVHAQYSDPDSDDIKQYTFEINKLSADLVSGAGLNIAIN